jgi:hypothetical protein
LHVALAILRHVNIDEGDSISTRALSYLNTTLTSSYPPQSSTGEEATFKLLKGIHHTIISVHISLLEPTILAVQTGLAVWIEDKYVILSVELYNDLVSTPSFKNLLVAYSDFFYSLCLSTIRSSSV